MKGIRNGKTVSGSPPISEADTVPAGREAPRLIYLDLETQKSAEDVGGWQNAHLMRISVLVLFDSKTEDYHVFDEASIDDAFAYLEKAALVVGFNIKRFDYKVLGAYTNGDLRALPTFDILEDVHRRLGFRLGLDHLAKETLNRRKTADGLQALEWFRQGELEKLTKYCKQDVAVTCDLFQFGLKNGHLIYREKRSNKRVRLLVDWDLENLIKAVGHHSR